MSIIVVDIVFGLIVAQMQQGTIGYDVLLALITGATASAIVSLVIEFSNNYRHNKLAWYELSDYYSAISDYELSKHILMKTTPTTRAEQKAIDEFVARGGVIDSAEIIEEKHDIVQATWKLLPSFMPIIKEALMTKKAYLSDNEITLLSDIMRCYDQIRSEVRHRLGDSLLYNTLNHPDEGFLNGLFPENILNDMPVWIKKHIAGREVKAATDRVVDAIMADDFIMHRYMDGYDISLHGLESFSSCLDEDDDDYDTTDAEDEEEEYDSFEDDDDFCNGDEETFKARNDAMHKYLAEQNMPFVSWHISKCCSDISRDLDMLEQLLVKKPYYGFLLRYNRDLADAPIDDIVSTVAYESEKRRLDRKLRKQETDRSSIKQ